MAIIMKKTAPTTKLNSQISTTSNLNGDLGQSDPISGNALWHLAIFTFTLARCEWVLLLKHFQSILSTQSQGIAQSSNWSKSVWELIWEVIYLILIPAAEITGWEYSTFGWWALVTCSFRIAQYLLFPLFKWKGLLSWANSEWRGLNATCLVLQNILDYAALFVPFQRWMK